MNAAVIICAAGASRRFGGKTKKIFERISGTPVFLRSINLFNKIDYVKQIILAISAEDEEKINLNWGANLAFDNIEICIGADQRWQTVQNAISMVSEDIDVVAVHDAARCCTKDECIDQAFQTARKTSAAILACPVVPTIKRVQNGQIISTIDRANLYEAQTPQVFEKNLLIEAYNNIANIDTDKTSITDDCSLVELLGKTVSVVPSDSSNIKITGKIDLAIAEAIIRSQEKCSPKPFHPFMDELR